MNSDSNITKIKEIAKKISLDKNVSYHEFNEINWNDIKATQELSVIINELFYDMQQWFADSDIREKDKSYEKSKRDRIKHWYKEISKLV